MQAQQKPVIQRIEVFTVGVRGVVRAVFGERILAYFKRRNGDLNAAVPVIRMRLHKRI